VKHITVEMLAGTQTFDSFFYKCYLKLVTFNSRADNTERNVGDMKQNLHPYMMVNSEDRHVCVSGRVCVCDCTGIFACVLVPFAALVFNHISILRTFWQVL